ncbi:MAG TPA: M48 family peptidase, partial [Anaerolineae bacterium]|nr:M48 family peptidase [Anaerolineae bacterium]
MSAANLRISGLVKAAKWAREQLAMGIPPQEAEGFRQRVRGTLEQVETICREHHIRPQDLPAPSYHAYGFLKEISLETLPLPSTTGKP